MKIIPYQKNWPQKFETEKEKLSEIFGQGAIMIEHIGSTSIPGLAAKNIVDIGILIEHAEDANKYVGELEKLGYTFNGTSTERHFFRKYQNDDNYHLSIAYQDRGSFWNRQILFRDFLIANPKYTEEYQNLKKDLIEKDPTGGDEYIGGKTKFVNKVLALAGFQDPNYKTK
jgi:GrpB-like predicted nucleotidyltransferase (UPF0157 family)